MFRRTARWIAVGLIVAVAFVSVAYLRDINRLPMLRSITFIKTAHTVIFIFLSVILALLLYEVTFDKITSLTWIAVALLTIEGIVLMAFGWKCPLTVYTESLGAHHGQVTDIFLPKWFADRVFVIYGGLFTVALLFLAIRLLS